MKLELVSYALCPFVHRSTTVLHEKGVPFDVQTIELSGKPDWFTALSPRGKVPLLVVDGTPLFESAVINEFVDDTQPGPRLAPDDPLERARHRAWIEVANDLFAAQSKLVTAEAKEDYGIARARLDDVLGLFEREIRGPFFGGDAFGLVDAAVAPAFYRFAILEQRSGVAFLAQFPKVEAWARRLATRPSVTRGVLPSFASAYLEHVRSRSGHLARALAAAA